MASRKNLETQFASFCKIVTVLDEKVATTADDNTLGIQLIEAQNLLDRFSSIYSSLSPLLAGSSLSNFVDIHHTFTHQLYTIMQTINNKLKSSTQHLSVNHSARVSLPPLELPTFSGTITDWPTFASLFETGISSHVGLTDCQKLQYLLNSLKGEAKSIVAHIPPVPGAFEEAWTCLLRKYDRLQDQVFQLIYKLLDIPPATTASELERIADAVIDIRRGLRLLGYAENSFVIFYLPILLRKIDPITRAAWQLQQDYNIIPNTETFIEFIIKHGRSALCKFDQSMRPKDKQSNRSFKEQKAIEWKSSIKCPECKLDHVISKCPIFYKATVEDRWALVSKLKLCSNCLRGFHTVDKCTRQGTCFTCQKKHHTMLHNQVQIANTALGSDQLLSTAAIFVKGKNGKQFLIRVLLDTGSTGNYLRRETLQMLDLPCQETNLTISTIHGTSVCRQSLTRITVASTKEAFEMAIDVMEMQGNQSTPCASKNIILPPQVRRHQLADDFTNTSCRLDGILSSEVFAMVHKGECIKWNGLLFQNTTLGWIVQGTGQGRQINRASTALMSLSPQINSFWELEEVPKRSFMSKEQQEAESSFINTTKILENGRYQTNIPLKSNPPNLGFSRHLAKNRLLSLERKMAKHPDFARLYTETIQDYIDNEHMILCTGREATRPDALYLPHHGVMSSSKTTKLRIVFDASAKTTNGKSINQETFDCPKTQRDLFHILLKFRTYQIALCGDIKQMYKQILINPQQHHLQRILWRFSPNDPVSDYELTTVTWGTKCAPYLATRVINDIANRNKDDYPIVCDKLLNDLYVDDIMSGSDSATAAIELYKGISNILGNHGFQMHKWASNSQSVLNAIPPDQQQQNLRLVNDNNECQKALGILWHCPSDNFRFEINLTSVKKCTKRSTLAQTNSIFDPLGWLTPVLLRPKLFMQHLWKESLDWDTILTEDLQEKWKKILEDLMNLEQIDLPRKVIPKDSQEQILCGFSDASERAYSAVVYLRSVTPTGPKTSLVAAKSKLAPLHSVSLPRLELCGALLLAKLVQAIRQGLEQEIDCIAYTDSEIALHWVRSEPYKWNTFVANRVSEIQKIIPSNHWRHVPGHDNPADCASRGIQANVLKNHPIWWTGPDFLVKEDYDNQQSQTEGNLIMEERKAVKTKITFATIEEQRPLFASSSVTKFVRKYAYVIRFIEACRGNKRTGSLSAIEKENASICCWRMLQKEMYPKEYELLEKKKPLPISNSLSCLAPFMDSHGLIRVGGRISRSHLPYHQRHQILISRKHSATTTLLRELHEKYLHAGPQLLATVLNQSFWIPQSRNLIRKTVHDCVRCTRLRAATAHQMMADLPDHRVVVSRPFATTGVDLAGPFNLKTHHLRGNRSYKSWICLFICMATRAVHIELVTSQSADAFLAAFHRFVSRRGLPKKMLSDNGTNFQATSTKLKAIIQEPTIANNLTNNNIEWQFIPPGAPHFGGLWEAGIKSTKYHLNRVVGNVALTYEEFTTVLARIEACMNSRPLSSLSDDPNDLEALTPAHFLVMGPLLAVPEEEPPNKILPLKRWQLTQQLARHFWKRWSNEYISRLQQRPKWLGPIPNLEIGQLVLIKEDNLNPLDWRLGRIIDTHPGADGLVRRVILRTALRTLERPVTKICPLPLERK